MHSVHGAVAIEEEPRYGRNIETALLHDLHSGGLRRRRSRLGSIRPTATGTWSCPLYRAVNTDVLTTGGLTAR